MPSYWVPPELLNSPSGAGLQPARMIAAAIAPAARSLARVLIIGSRWEWGLAGRLGGGWAATGSVADGYPVVVDDGELNPTAVERIGPDPVQVA